MEKYLFLDVRIVKYLGFGALQFILDISLFVVMSALDVPLLIANVVSRLSAATAGYYLNKKYTFAIGEVKTYSMARRYWVFWTFMTVFSSLLVWCWDRFLGDAMPTNFGKFVIECFLCVFGYLISKYWVYKHDPE